MTLVEQPSTESAEFAPPGATDRAGRAGRRRRRFRILALLTVGVVGGWALLPAYGARLSQDVDAHLPVDAGLMIDDYGPAGTYSLHYQHGESVTVRVPVSNRGPLPLTIDTASIDSGDYPLLVPADDNLPLTVEPWSEQDMSLEFTFDNCRYYHERAAETYDEVAVSGSVLGRGFDKDIMFEHPLVLHGQVILDCPDRTLRRDDDHPLRR